MKALRSMSVTCAWICTVATLLAGCSTQVWVNPLPADVKSGDEVNGLPFRTVQRYRLELYQRVGDKYVAVVADKRMATLADLEHVYVFQMRGMPFSNDTVTVSLNSDNTIKKLTLDPKGQTKEALDKLTSVVGDIDTAKSTKATAAEAAASAGETRRLTALQARQAADLAAVEVAALPADTTAVARKAAENKLALAKLVANQAARRAGQALPFPEAGT